MEKEQISFSGGLFRQFDTTRVGVNQYPYLANGRVREDVVSLIKKPVELVLPIAVAKVQGVYAAENLSVVFADGKAFYKDFSANPSTTAPYTEIVGFAMSADVDYIYAELVPTSSLNYSRKSNGGNASDPVTIFGVAAQSRSGLICQDGINQPRLILDTGNQIVLGRYNDWTLANREYVPIGKQMLMGDDGVLYIVAADGSQIFRSVTGRPLDFVIPVDTNGDKIGDEQEGGAPAMAHKVSFQSITSIRKTSNSGPSFLVATLGGTWLVSPNYNKLLFGEPLLDNITIATTGAVNQFSTSELLGDTAWIDQASIRSFNAVQQLKWNGKNSIFSRQINGIIGTNTQPADVCSIEFDNYTLFNLLTVYGRRTLVYDQTLQQFVAVDSWTGVTGIKQFAVLRINTSLYELLFITTDNKLFQAYASTQVESGAIYIGDRISESTKNQIRPSRMKLTFMDARERGTVFASVYVDGKLSITERYNDFIKENFVAQAEPITPPFGDSTTDNVKAIEFDLGRQKTGWKVGLFIEWAFDAKLMAVYTEFNEETSVNNFEQQAADQEKYLNKPLSILDFTPRSVNHLANVTITGSGFLTVQEVFVGDVECDFDVTNDNSMVISIPVTANTGQIKLFAATNEVFSDTLLTIT